MKNIKESIKSFVEFRKKKQDEIIHEYKKEVIYSIINDPSSPIENLKNIIDISDSSEIEVKVSMIIRSSNYPGGYFIYEDGQDINNIKSWVISEMIEEVDDSLLNLINEGPTFVYSIGYDRKNGFDTLRLFFERVLSEYEVEFDPIRSTSYIKMGAGRPLRPKTTDFQIQSISDLEKAFNSHGHKVIFIKFVIV